jgi:hypothetical protein
MRYEMPLLLSRVWLGQGARGSLGLRLTGELKWTHTRACWICGCELDTIQVLLMQYIPYSLLRQADRDNYCNATAVKGGRSGRSSC